MDEDRLKEKRMSVHVYYRYESLVNTHESDSRPRFRGPLRLFVFCLIAIILPCCLLIAPLYIRYVHFKDAHYSLLESDSVLVDRPISSFWCEGQELSLNDSSDAVRFEAYKLDLGTQKTFQEGHSELSKTLHMESYSLELFGFFLTQGSRVIVSTCSRFEGARLTLIKGKENLENCGIAAPDDEEEDAPQGNEESYAEETFDDDEFQSYSVHRRIRLFDLEDPGRRTNETTGVEGQPPTQTVFKAHRWDCPTESSVFSMTLDYTMNCTADLNLQTIVHNTIVHEIGAKDFYYFMLHHADPHFNGSGNEVANFVNLQFDLTRMPLSLSNVTGNSSYCTSLTKCSLPLEFLTTDRVLIRIPMTDSLKDFDNVEQHVVVSHCLPRLGIYFIFPVCILLLVLYCAFI